MNRLLKILGFIFTWFIPFAVVYVNHVIFTESNVDVDMFGLLIIIALTFGLIRMVDRKCEVWELQKEHKLFILNWKNSKKVILIGMVTWVLFTIEDNLGKMQLSAILILLSFIIGWILTVLGNIRTNKKATQNE